MAQPTIRDVARRAQVSVATVSRVLNGFANVSEETRKRVDEAVQALGYVPHAAARSLSLAQTHAIGVVLPDLHGEFFSEIVRGMDRVASGRGYVLLLSNLHGGAEQATVALKAMRGRVDGLVVMAPHLDGDALSSSIPAGLPCVLVNTRDPAGQFPTIHLDNRAGARAVLDHFASLGRKRLVHIAGPEQNIDSQERAEAFLEAAAQRGIDCVTMKGDFAEESGRAAIAALIDSGRKFDAVFAANDNMAIGAIEGLRAAGIKVPEDVAVAGFDDIPLARHLGMTTVQVHIAELGERALGRLLAFLEDGTESGEELHSPELVVRGTTSTKADR